MLACVDVDYRADHAVAACVLFRDWEAAHSTEELVCVISEVAEYEPGKFYKRELPCLLAVLEKCKHPLEAIVVDGYVWLTDEQHPGLGGHLFAALGNAIPVIGVAKTRFLSCLAAREVRRGESDRPLYVTSAGLAVEHAVDCVGRMSGEYRVPRLLKLVDQLCRNS